MQYDYSKMLDDIKHEIQLLSDRILSLEETIKYPQNQSDMNIGMIKLMHDHLQKQKPQIDSATMLLLLNILGTRDKGSEQLDLIVQNMNDRFERAMNQVAEK